ncbi:MAG: tetratricopeptide repeat protein, partial [Xenococcus sp. (in: cyanobacteria)]
LRSLRRRKGFGIFFVQCTPVGGQELIAKVEADLPQKNIDVLELDKPIDNLIELVEALPNREQLKILFIVGLEKSLVEYIRPGYGGVGDYYKLDTVPPILNHLNWQRENFRDRFRQLCFIFLLPPFALKYILHRAPDFADWRSGMVDVPTDRQLIEQETTRLWMEGSIEKYRQWTPQQRLERIAEIQTYLAENPNRERSADLWFEQGNILEVNEEYEKALYAHDQAISIKPDDPIFWYNRGVQLSNLGRSEEAIASYDKALAIKPDNDSAWYNRGIALGNLGRYEEAIASYERVVEIQPNDHEAWYQKADIYAIQNQVDLAIENLEKAILLDKKYCNMAMEDSDFDNIRQDLRFQKLIEQSL